MNTQKGFAPILIILLGLVVIGGGYFFVKNKTKKIDSVAQEEKKENSSFDEENKKNEDKPITNDDYADQKPKIKTLVENGKTKIVFPTGVEMVLFENNFELGIIADRSVQLSIELCDEKSCYGKGFFVFRDPETKEIKQVFVSEDAAFFRNTLYFKLEQEFGTYTKSGPINSQDYNFDGYPDYAIRNGRNECLCDESGDFGSPVYDVYLYNPIEKSFFLDSNFTNIFSRNHGYISFEDKTERTFSILSAIDGKWVEYWTYKVLNGPPLLIEKYGFDSSEVDTGYVTLTRESLVNGEWKKSTVRTNDDDFFKSLYMNF